MEVLQDTNITDKLMFFTAANLINHISCVSVKCPLHAGVNLFADHTQMPLIIWLFLHHTLLPAIETTDVIGNTDNKQVKRNMSKYFQRMFMLISLSLGYLFYDTYSYFL